MEHYTQIWQTQLDTCRVRHEEDKKNPKHLPAAFHAKFHLYYNTPQVFHPFDFSEVSLFKHVFDQRLNVCYICPWQFS